MAKFSRHGQPARAFMGGLTAAGLIAGQALAGGPATPSRAAPAPAAAPRSTPAAAPAAASAPAARVPSSFKPRDYSQPPSGREVRSLPPVGPAPAPPSVGGGHIMPGTSKGEGISAGGYIQTPRGGASGSITSVPGGEVIQATGNRQVAPNVNIHGSAGASSSGERTGGVGATIDTP